MRRFTPEYLADTRAGLWDDREVLSALGLPARERMLDVGCGAGDLTRVLREESAATVVGLDADRVLLERVDPPRTLGGAGDLPFADGAFDLVVCQALLVNLADPIEAVDEFARTSSDLVAAIEPDNARVRVDSTVAAESRLARRARAAYIDGVGTDVTLGADAADAFESTGLEAVGTARHDHRRTVEPPYSRDALAGAARKASAARLDDHRETMLAGDLSAESYDELRAAWREMGREVVDQMRAGEYRREERVPFYLTVGSVPSAR